MNIIKNIGNFVLRGVKLFVIFMASKISPPLISLFITRIFANDVFNSIKIEDKIYHSILALLILVVIFCILWFFVYQFIKLMKWFLKLQWQETQQMWQDFKKRDIKKHIITLDNNNLFQYQQAIDLIAKSLYGLFKITEAINSGQIKETGGYFYKQKTGLAVFVGGEVEIKELTAEEKLEIAKQNQIYNRILQEFCKEYGFYNEKQEYQEKNSQYSALSMYINKNDLDIFLRNK